MKQVSQIFELFYPATLIFLIVLVAIGLSLIYRQKKSKSLNILIFFSIVFYFVSFFSNYDLQFFMIAWFLRDLLIFIISIKIWTLYLKYKRSFIIGIFLVALGLGFWFYRVGSLSFTKASPATFETAMEAELLFEIKNKSLLSKVNDLLSSFKPEISLAFPQIQDTSITDLDNCYTIDIKDTSILNLLMDTLEKSGLTNWIEKNEVYTLSPIEKLGYDSIIPPAFRGYSLNDPYVSRLWGFRYMEIDSLTELLKKRKPVKKAKIFILDTGVDGKHEDLTDNYISLSDKYDTDTDQHGTHCAGIACAVSNNKKGIASFNLTGKFSTVTSITVLPGGSGTQESIIDGIILAADHGADVISMSLGGFSNEVRQKAYEKAIKYANDKGAIIVVAAGNENTNAKNVVPASCKGVITVSAVDENLQKAAFSNYVTDIEYKVAAPGVNIYSTIPLNQYKSMNGTSMATPYVAGLIGIMKSIEPNITTEEAFRMLISSGIDSKNSDQTGKFIQPLKTISNMKDISFISRLKLFVNEVFTFKP